jgi:hypothetical protein
MAPAEFGKNVRKKQSVPVVGRLLRVGLISGKGHLFRGAVPFHYNFAGRSATGEIHPA